MGFFSNTNNTVSGKVINSHIVQVEKLRNIVGQRFSSQKMKQLLKHNDQQPCSTLQHLWNQYLSCKILMHDDTNIPAWRYELLWQKQLSGFSILWKVLYRMISDDDPALDLFDIGSDGLITNMVYWHKATEHTATFVSNDKNLLVAIAVVMNKLPDDFGYWKMVDFSVPRVESACEQVCCINNLNGYN